MSRTYYSLPYPKSKKELKAYNIRTWKEFDVHNLLKEIEIKDDIYDPIIDEEYSEYKVAPWRVSREYLNLNILYATLAVPDNEIDWDLFRFRYFFECGASKFYKSKQVIDVFKAYSKISNEELLADLDRICLERQQKSLKGIIEGTNKSMEFKSLEEAINSDPEYPIT